MNGLVRTVCLLAMGSGYLAAADARPIVLAEGVTVMGEYGAGTMSEVQAFYAPNFRYSFGPGYLSLEDHVNPQQPAGSTGGHSHGGGTATSTSQSTGHDITYLRLNVLPLRWNMESAQANVLVWGSAGQVNFWNGGQEFAWNVGGQVDYETRRIYTSLRTDLYEASVASHRIDTLQLGIAPYKHDYDTPALWFLVQARQYGGTLIHQGTEISALLRLFTRTTWIEAGVTQDGRIQAMVMFNY